MNQIPHSNGDELDHKRRAQAAQRGHRTRRLSVANKPFDLLDREVAEVVRRMDLDEGEDGHLDRNVGRVMLTGLALRKDLELARDHRTQTIMKLEEVDVRSEFEELKRELGLAD